MKRLLLTACFTTALAAAEDPLRFYRAKLDNPGEIRELLDLSANYRAFTHFLFSSGLKPDSAQLIRACAQSRALAPESRENVFTFRASVPKVRNLSVNVALDPLTSQFAGLSARYAVLHSRDPRGPELRARWIQRTLGNAAQALAAPSARLLETIAAAYESIETNPSYEAWLDAATVRLAAAPKASLGSELEAELDNLALLVARIDPQIGSKLANILQAYEVYVNVVTQKPTLSLEYAQATRSTKTARAIFEWNPRASLASLTATAAMTFEGPRRNWEAGAQYEHPIAPSTFLTASAAYDGVHVVSEAGIALRLAGSGIRLPIGLAWIDRTRRPGARFGIALDLDTLFIK